MTESHNCRNYVFVYYEASSFVDVFSRLTRFLFEKKKALYNIIFPMGNQHHKFSKCYKFPNLF